MHNALGDERLLALLDERRRKEGAEKEAIDRRIWALFGEEWCVMATDLAGFSRGVAEFGIVHFLEMIRESERLLLPLIQKFEGQLLKIEGDSFLVIFREAANGVRAAVAMQRAARQYNEGRAPADQMLLGIGLGYGTVLRVGESEVFGAEVNSACILGETYARPFAILATQAVVERMPQDLSFEEFDFTPPGAGAAWQLRYE